MVKTKVTKTYNIIHFEDLDPHRFEDLVRELIYDYRDWATIEATGRSGNEQGFDIRAYEKISKEDGEVREEEGIVERHPMDGNLWMIQAKREKSIGPKKVKEIVADVDEKNTPYGYILAAACEFSKKTRDIFREELKKKGVMEFYIWSRSELEDMLHLPKNDRILFTFFGISLASKKRGKVTEVRAPILIKNRIFSALGEDPTGSFNKPVLLRDLNDDKYPFEGEITDFELNPKWREYTAFRYHPLGVWFHIKDYYAYIDTHKKEWSFSKKVNLVHKEVEFDDEREDSHKNNKEVRATWEFFKKSQQGHFIVDGFVKYEDIFIVDPKGDSLYTFPHFYANFVKQRGPFSLFRHTLKIGGQKFDLDDSWNEVGVFPAKLPSSAFGKIHKRQKVVLEQSALDTFKDSPYDINFLCDVDGRYDFLNQRDVVTIAESGGEEIEDTLIQVTAKFKIKTKDFLNQREVGFSTNRNIQNQLGRDPKQNELLNIYEFKIVSRWELEKDVK